ncbi:MAG: hypothetical protein IJ131_08060 [Eggerthellaceae bacterium]|nr:hypothetical protein [Eggerthellaceae bacterium]
MDSGNQVSKEQVFAALAAFVVDVAENWRDAGPEALRAMVKVAKSYGSADAMDALINNLKELDI